MNSIFTDLYSSNQRTCLIVELMSSKDSDSQTKAQADTDPNETLGYDFFPARAGHLET